ncbi:MAG TPA: response regulator transcription factor [Phycisphaerae bacterium]|nr:response regulator transcription factor [Phycisphaerae bacterium]
MRILIVEDEEKLARNIAKVLRQLLDAAVDISIDGQDGCHMAMSEPYDAVILDLMLPKMDGLSLLQELRKRGVSVPILILTAKHGTDNVISGLNAGSDDYLTKPFEMAELVARVRALMRRSYNRPAPNIDVGELTIDLAARQAHARGQPMHLRPLEFALLEYLGLRSGTTVSKTEILEHLYDFNAETFSNVVEVHISRLRKELQRLGDPCRIRTVRGMGYRLEPPE